MAIEHDDVRNGGKIKSPEDIKFTSTFVPSDVFFTQTHCLPLMLYQNKVRYLIIVALSYPEGYCVCVQMIL